MLTILYLILQFHRQVFKRCTLGGYHWPCNQLPHCTEMCCHAAALLTSTTFLRGVWGGWGFVFFLNPMCENLLSLPASSFLFQATFYKKEHFVSQCDFNTYIFLPYSDWHSDMYPFYKTHHVNHTIYFLKYYFLSSIFE